MAKTVFITGSSSGIGRATAEIFSSRGWNVAATMRNPEKEEALGELPNVKLFPLDVLDNESVKNTIKEIVQVFGKIDVLVNNAGYAAIGPFEAAEEDQILRQFGTNVFGMMRVTKGILPHFRNHGGGMIINISSVAGRTSFPLFSLYNSTKWAVEGFTEALRYELRQFNIRVKLIEPGAIKTDFYSRSMEVMESKELDIYTPYVKRVLKKIGMSVGYTASPAIVAGKIYRVADCSTGRLRYPVGGGAGIMLFFRRILPTRWFNRMVSGILE